jgi:hypothetical protein
LIAIGSAESLAELTALARGEGHARIASRR